MTPADGMCSPEGTVPAGCRGTAPSSLGLRPRPLCWEVGAAGQQAPGLFHTPHSLLPPVSLSETVPSASSLGSSRGCAPATLPGLPAPRPPLPGRPPRPPGSTVTVLTGRGASVPPEGRLGAVHPRDPPTQACALNTMDKEAYLKQGGGCGHAALAASCLGSSMRTAVAVSGETSGMSWGAAAGPWLGTPLWGAVAAPRPLPSGHCCMADRCAPHRATRPGFWYRSDFTTQASFGV